MKAGQSWAICDLLASNEGARMARKLNDLRKNVYILTHFWGDYYRVGTGCAMDYAGKYTVDVFSI
jgi:hypothetical protein